MMLKLRKYSNRISCDVTGNEGDVDWFEMKIGAVSISAVDENERERGQKEA